MLSAIITDLDGTLVDTMAANFAAYSTALAEQGVILTREAYVNAFGLRAEDLLREVAPGLDADQVRVVQARKLSLYPQYFDLVAMNNDLMNFLVFMKKRLPIAMATTARFANGSALLRHLNLSGLFDVQVFAEDVSRGKPDPACYRLCAERLGVSPSDCLIFEDSEVGIRAAEAAGSQVCRVPPITMWNRVASAP